MTALVYSPNGLAWAASSAAGEVVWNDGLSEMVVLQAADGYSIERIAFSADSCWLAAGGQAGQLLIWNCADTNLPPQQVSSINLNKWIEQLAWHPTKPYLAVSYGSQLKIWDILTSTETVAWKFDQSSIFDLAWHPSGEYLAIAGYKGVQIWSPRDIAAPQHSVEVATASIKIAWSGDGRYLVMGNLDRTLTILDWHHPDDSWTLQGCPGKIRQLSWLEGTATPCLAVASGTAIVLWHLTSDATIWNGQLLEGHQDTVEALAAHPHAPILASGGADGYTCLWSAQGSIEQILNNIVSQFTTLGWHPHGTDLATGSQAGEIGLWTIPA